LRCRLPSEAPTVIESQLAAAKISSAITSRKIHTMNPRN